MFGLLQSIMPLHARKQYPKPWLQQTRGSDIERSPKIFSSEKNRVPDMGGKCCEKKQSPHFLWTQFFSRAGKKQSPRKVGTLFFSQHFPPMSGTLFFFRAEIFGLLSPSLTLLCWSQGFGYGFLASYGIIICTRPNFLKNLLRKRATYL